MDNEKLESTGSGARPGPDTPNKDGSAAGEPGRTERQEGTDYTFVGSVSEWPVESQGSWLLHERGRCNGVCWGSLCVHGWGSDVRCSYQCTPSVGFLLARQFWTNRSRQICASSASVISPLTCPLHILVRRLRVEHDA